MKGINFSIGDLPEEYAENVLDILCECDNEFYPPLSARKGTTQKGLTEGVKNSEKPLEYFNELKKQQFILACIDERLCAFLSYKVKESPDEFYVSTLCVTREFRGRGLLHILYDKLEETALLKGVKILSTRTWSTHEAQIKTLGKHGYKITKRIENDRPNGVGTVYFEKTL